MSAAIRIAGAARSAQRVTASDDDRRIGLDAAYEADVDDSTLAVRDGAGDSPRFSLVFAVHRS